MSDIKVSIKYCLDPLSPFPRRWIDKHGPFRVMAEPIDGYLMVRRPGCFPFVLSVKQILNASPHEHGPFAIANPESGK